MEGSTTKIYEFGNFRFDAKRLHLEYDQQAVNLPPKSLQTLKVLLEKQGETVTRENLLEKVWAESFVEDANLTVAVSNLRKTLSDIDASETYIQTIPRRGYRFVADTIEIDEIIDAPIVIGHHAVEQFTVERDVRKHFSRAWIAVGLLGLMAVTAFGIWFGKERASQIPIANVSTAAEAYTKGHALLQKRMVCESLPYFRAAVSIDDRFVNAYADLAAATAMCDITPEADSTIAKALALAPDSSEVQASDGFIKMFRHWDWDGAETALRRSVDIDPNSAKSHHWLGVCLSIRGQLREAVGEMLRAIEIEPDSPLYHADLGQVYYFDRRYDVAVSECQKALEIDPEFLFTHKYLVDIYLAKGNEKEALKHSLAYAKVIGASAETISRAQNIFDHQGYRGISQAEIDTALINFESAGIRDRATFSLQLADVHSRTGDAPNTLRWLQETVENPPETWPFTVAYIGVEPRFAFLRKQTEFQSILEKLKLSAVE